MMADEAVKGKGGAKTRAPARTAADRVARHVAERNELGDIPKPLRPDVRERCRDDLELFGWTYCRALLDHRPSPEFKARVVDKLQAAVMSGGQFAVEALRGGGKTTWFCITVAWGILYGHFHFPVIVTAAQPLAKNLRRAIMGVFETSDAVRDDFPAVAVPLRAIGGIAQKGAVQTYRGAPTGYISSDMVMRLPMLRDETSGAPLDAGCGALLAVRGVGSSVRGLNVDGVRPDFVLLDDPQTQKDARSASAVKRIDDYIHSDVLGLAANTSTLAAFVAITPQRFGDLAHRIFDKNLHPNWVTSVCPAILRTCDRFEELVDEFVDAYHADMAAEDFTRAGSTAWYREHAAEFEGVEMLDPLAFDRAAEADAIHHALNKIASVGKEAFAAEYQMKVSSADAELALTADLVSAACNGAPPWTLPPGCDCAAAACDVNVREGEGLSWCVVGFGPGRVAAVVAYGRYPAHGALVAPGSSDLAKKRAVAKGVRAVVADIAAHPIRRTDGRRVTLRALGFDRGYLPDVIGRTLYVLRRRMPLPFQLCQTRGVGWSNFDEKRKDRLRGGDHVCVRPSPHGEYLEVLAPYWREIAQSGFLETPLMPGSVSLFGADRAAHWQFASEVAAERLERKYTHPSGKTAWDWTVTGANHYGDALTYSFAIGSYFRCFETLPRVLDRIAAKDSADLFDPRLNPAVAASVAAAGGNGAATGAAQPADGGIVQKLAKANAKAKRPRFAKRRWTKK